MNRFKNIIYIPETADKKEEAVAAAVQSLARKNNAEVCVVGTFEERQSEQIGKIFSSRLKSLPDLVIQQRREELLESITADGWKGISVSAELLQGKDFIAIIQKVLRDGHDLIIKKRVIQEGGDLLAMRLFRKCPCPVWVISDSESVSCKTVLAALDLGNNQPENRLLNRTLIDLAVSLAGGTRQGEVHYLHAWRLEFEAMMHSPRFNLSLDEVAGIKEEVWCSYKDTLDGLFQKIRLDVSPANIHILEGETVEVIQRTIDFLGVDLLLMGAIARTGVPGLIIGNTAEKVLSQVDCSVLVVKPEGYVSPVKMEEK
ncbi:MAG: universal stress protein [Desulfopila sp.]|jgi:hypothetical protein|nr:universal stress protein [Desulfopila sp.]